MKLTRTQQDALVTIGALRLEDAFLPLDGILDATLSGLVARGLVVIEPTLDGRRLSALTDAGRAEVGAIRSTRASGVSEARRLARKVLSGHPQAWPTAHVAVAELAQEALDGRRITNTGKGKALRILLGALKEARER